MDAQQADSLVSTAIAVQVQGPGGCRQPWVADTMPARFFQTVTVVRGTCTREHGELEEVYVGLDGHGRVYVLGCSAAFEFMRRLNPPVPITSTDAVAYVVEALRYSGRWVPGTRTVIRSDSVPTLLRRKLRLGEGPLSTATVTPGGRYRVVIHSMSTRLLMQYEVFVNPDGAVLLAAGRSIAGAKEVR